MCSWRFAILCHKFYNCKRADNFRYKTYKGEFKKMSKVTAVISAFNEEKNIERCLKSLIFADEIVVVDNSSTDKTSEIAKKYTKKVFVQKNNPNLIDLQKNFGFEKASFEWILSIDADEEVSRELAEEIRATIKNKNEVAGYW